MRVILLIFMGAIAASCGSATVGGGGGGSSAKADTNSSADAAKSDGGDAAAANSDAVAPADGSAADVAVVKDDAGANDAVAKDAVQPDVVQVDVPVVEKDSGSGCKSDAACDDGFACTSDICGISGSCTHVPNSADCDDANPCTIDACSAGAGCTNTPKSGSCDDKDACTSGDTCKAGVCAGVAKICNDNDACTTDSCSSGVCKFIKDSNCGDGSTIDSALQLNDKQPLDDTLNPTGTIKWFKFDGKAGDFVLISTATDQKNNPFNPDTIDTVVQLYDPQKKPYALNDDSQARQDNDSELWTMLPSTGTYYVQVSECATYLAANPGLIGTCADPVDKTAADFKIYLQNFTLVPAASVIHEGEPNDKTTQSTKIVYEKAPSGNYYLNILYGKLAAAGDIDWFSFALPLDTKVGAGTRANADITSFTGGVDGDGSLLQDWQVVVVAADNPVQLLAKCDLTTGDLSLPVTLGKTYYAAFSHAKAKTTANDFYIASHSGTGSNPLEQNEVGNNLLSGAEKLVVSGTKPNYYIAGDLINAGKDIDHFSMQVPLNTSKFSVYCASASSGSGLVDLAVNMLQTTGAALVGGTGVESGKILEVKDVAVPPGVKTVILRLSAAGQAPDVSGAFYQCGVAFAP